MYIYTQKYIFVYQQPAEQAPFYESQALTGSMSEFA